MRNGRHTYLYHPGEGEDPAPVLHHLLQAGLVVLLVLDSNQPLPEGVKSFQELSGAADGADSQQIAAAILHHSMLDSMMTPNNWII